jgi:hypothetical protein
MTRAPNPATGKQPLRRLVETMDSEMVVELTDRLCTLRPKGTRRGGPAEVEITWGALYLRLMAARAEEKRRAKKKGRRR